jgi:hypothetical protein
LWEASKKLKPKDTPKSVEKAAEVEGEEPNPHPPGTMAYQLWEASKKLTSAKPKVEEKPKDENANPHAPGSLAYQLFEAS